MLFARTRLIRSLDISVNSIRRMQKLTISVESDPKPQDVRVLEEELHAYLDSKGVPRDHKPLAVFLRNHLRRVVGGVCGETYSGWLYIQTMWVREDLQDQGYGTELMRAVEQEAIKRGCRSAYLSTIDKQALEFYEKFGYRVCAELVGFPQGHSAYLMKKERLSEWGAAPESVAADV